MSDQNNYISTSQKFLDIHDISNDILILKNGSTAVILTVNAMNFGLLAEEEQDAVIYSYASLLNSINYPIQIIIRSETKDASSYLKILEERKKEAGSEIKRTWIQRYSQFVSDLIKERNVLDKKFYVVIPAGPLEMGLTPGQNMLSGFKESQIKDVDKNIILEKALNLLEPKKDHLIAQFNRIGLYARQLKTQEIIRLFYTSYNPEASEGQHITNSQSYTTPLVQAQIRGNIMAQSAPNNNQNQLEQAQNAQAQTQQPAGQNQPVSAPTSAPAQTQNQQAQPSQQNQMGSQSPATNQQNNLQANKTEPTTNQPQPAGAQNNADQNKQAQPNQAKTNVEAQPQTQTQNSGQSQSSTQPQTKTQLQATSQAQNTQTTQPAGSITPPSEGVAMQNQQQNQQPPKQESDSLKESPTVNAPKAQSEKPINQPQMNSIQTTQQGQKATPPATANENNMAPNNNKTIASTQASQEINITKPQEAKTADMQANQVNQPKQNIQQSEQTKQLEVATNQQMNPSIRQATPDPEEAQKNIDTTLKNLSQGT